MPSIEIDRLDAVIMQLLAVAESADNAAREARAASMDHPGDELGQSAFRVGFLRARLSLITEGARTVIRELQEIRADLEADQ